MANPHWISLYPSAVVEHLRTESLDHTPILVHTTAMEKKGIRSFWFLEAWTTDDYSNIVVQEAWNGKTRVGMAEHKMKRALIQTAQTLSKWNKEYFGFAQTTITRLERELKRIQREDGISGDNQREIRANLEVQCNRLELILRQKSREVWLQSRDRNTKIFSHKPFI